MSLIIESIEPIKLKPLAENNFKGPYKILAQKANSRNQNKRRYPKRILNREVKRLKEECSRKSFMGELDHTFSEQIQLDRVSHIITDVWMEGDNVFVEFVLLDTPKGQIAKELIKSGVRLGISSRGTGTLLPDKNPGEFVVGEDYRMVTFDLVADPSVKEARLELMESEGNYKTYSIAESLNVLNTRNVQETLFLKDLKNKLQGS
jgi:hypothetical protein